MNAPPGGGWSALTPQCVLDAVEAAGLRPDGRLLQLNSYENRVHQVFLEDGTAVVTKFYRPGRWTDEQILEEHGFARELAAEEVPVVAPLDLQPEAGSPLRTSGSPPTLGHWPVDGGRELRFSVSPRCAGREPDLEHDDILLRVGRFIGRLHAVGRRRPFVHRVTLDPVADARKAIERLQAGDLLTEPERGPWLEASRLALAAVARAVERHGPWPALRLHGDCHLGNVLWRPEGPHVVDLDDACMGPAVQDLWMLASGEAAELRQRLWPLLEGYEEWLPFDHRQLSLIEPLRTVRMIRHSAWLADRWDDPAFPAAFGYFGTPAYWSQQVTQLREQLESMDAAGG